MDANYAARIAWELELLRKAAERIASALEARNARAEAQDDRNAETLERIRSVSDWFATGFGKGSEDEP
jgi:hypothetical protein